MIFRQFVHNHLFSGGLPVLPGTVLFPEVQRNQSILLSLTILTCSFSTCLKANGPLLTRFYWDSEKELGEVQQIRKPPEFCVKSRGRQEPPAEAPLRALRHV